MSLGNANRMTRNENFGANDTTGAAQALQEAFAHHRAGRLEEAVARYDEALRRDPGSVDALFNRSQIQLALGRLEEALAGFERVVALEPSDAGALRARGVVLQALGRHEEALASLDAALALDPGDAGAWNARGSELQALGRFEAALESFARARALKPDDALTHWNESLCRLAMGDYAHGWQQYEWRWKWSGFPSPRLEFRAPLWLGAEDVAGKTVILHAEQGLGDTIQFVRYAPLVAAKGASVVLMVQKILVPLMQGLVPAGPATSRRDGPAPLRVVGPGAPLPPADFHAPLLSLPLAFKTTLENVPAAVPYLAFDPEAVAAWRRKLGGPGERLVGICWRGSASYAGDRERSIPFAAFAPLLSVPGVKFIGLQKDLTAEELAVTGARPNFTNPAEDFTRTAEIVAALDLVITVDTAWGHLAGALGRPVWVLLPQVSHWCWLRDRRDSPWYPTARLFRQAARGDWDGVIRDVAQELRR